MYRLFALLVFIEYAMIRKWKIAEILKRNERWDKLVGSEIFKGTTIHIENTW